MAYRKDDIPKVTIERMKIGEKELSEEVANNILNGNFDLGIEKIAKDIVKRQDNAMAMQFTKRISELLKKNGVVPKMTEYTSKNLETDETFKTRYGVSIDELDFSEHDNQFKERIGFLTRKNEKLFDENKDLKQRIAELESKETEKQTKINLNDNIKVKLTPLGAEIYYHQYDELDKHIKKNGGTGLKPRMPQMGQKLHIINHPILF